jgi:pyruvate,water dikinase
MGAQPSPNPFIAWFETLGKGDVGRVGGKNASLGEMVQRLAPQGVRVPEGFATTAAAYRSYIEANGIGSALAARWMSPRAPPDRRSRTAPALDGEFPRQSQASGRYRSSRGAALPAKRASPCAPRPRDLPERASPGSRRLS